MIVVVVRNRRYLLNPLSLCATAALMAIVGVACTVSIKSYPRCKFTRSMIGGAGTAVLVADDATVIGVAGDPLIIVTGGVFVVGGVVVLVGELLSWWD